MTKKETKKALGGFNKWIAMLHIDFYLKNKRNINSIKAILEKELKI